MNKTPTYRLLATLLKRDPIADIRDRREAGQSWRRISLAYRDKTKIDVTEATLREWWKASREEEDETQAASG